MLRNLKFSGLEIPLIHVNRSKCPDLASIHFKVIVLINFLLLVNKFLDASEISIKTLSGL